LITHPKPSQPININTSIVQSKPTEKQLPLKIETTLVSSSPTNPKKNENFNRMTHFEDIINFDHGLEEILNDNLFLTPESKKRTRGSNDDHQLMYTPTVEDLLGKEENLNPNKKCRVNLESTAFVSVRFNCN
jgi:hypothetical protein